MRRELKWVNVGLLGSMAFAVAASGGCSDDGPSDTVYAEARPGVDFSKYKTFAVVTEDEYPDASDLPDPPPVPTDELPNDVTKDLASVSNAAVNELEMEGLKEVGVDDSPDLYLLNWGSTTEDDGYTWECLPNGYWYGWWNFWACDWVPVPISYTEGSIMVIVVDPDIKGNDDFGQVVFGGIAQGVLDGSSNQTQRIDDDVATMFKEWPETDDDGKDAGD